MGAPGSEERDAEPTRCTCSPAARTALAGAGSMPSPPASEGASVAAGGPSVGEHLVEQAIVPAGSFIMGDSSGDANPADGEVPRHRVSLDGFSIDATPVTVADFARFVSATDYRTDAERFGYSAVFHLALQAPMEDVLGRPGDTPWWYGVKGADWAHPGGRDSSTTGIEDHPVTHVSWQDSIAYCAWAGRRLPTEAEWEYASRGGLEGRTFPWGDEWIGDGDWRANVWQGRFPTINTLDDGYLTTAPVHSYQPNGYGLWQTVGNVWEWCADWFSSNYYRQSPANDPQGPDTGQARILRGGSYLCHESYCNRYRNSARSQNTPDSSMGNAGFRTVALDAV